MTIDKLNKAQEILHCIDEAKEQIATLSIQTLTSGYYRIRLNNTEIDFGKDLYSKEFVNSITQEIKEYLQHYIELMQLKFSNL